MPAEPLVKPLSRGTRTWVFYTLFAIFLLAMPVFLFYAMGYRVDFAGDRDIITVGGLYISADADDVAMFVNEKPVENMRIFQQAAYIQNLDAGIHRLHVQRDGLQTWVKELPVYSHIVTEAHAFNLPEVPQVRYIPEWLTEDGLPVLITNRVTTPIFPNASTTNTIVATTSPRTVTYTANTEYEYVASVFAATSSTDTTDARRAVDIFESDFTFAQPVDPDDMVATSTKTFRDMRLYESGDEVYATWIGSDRSVPYYFCVTHTSPATTTAEYGEHVYESLIDEFGTTTDFTTTESTGRYCRDTIRIDRDRQEVAWFGFLPNSMHHVLLLLEDGLYVVEVDDRAWQNVQVLYPGEDLEVRVDGGQIYVFDGEHYFEVFTEVTA